MRPVAVVGSLTRDVVEGGEPRVGGAPFYAARALARLDRPGLVVARCAAGDADELVPPLRALGVPVEWLPTSRTAAFSFRYEGDTRLMQVDEATDPWRVDELGPLEGACAVHVGALFRGEFGPDVLTAIADGRLLSLDGQGLVRVGATGPLQLDPRPAPGALAGVSILKLAEEEAETLLGGDVDGAPERLGVPEVVITRGSRGAGVRTAEGAWESPAPRVDGPVDPTGAGDAFSAAYLAARVDGAEPREALVAATTLATALVRR